MSRTTWSGPSHSPHIQQHQQQKKKIEQSSEDVYLFSIHGPFLFSLSIVWFVFSFSVCIRTINVVFYDIWHFAFSLHAKTKECVCVLCISKQNIWRWVNRRKEVIIPPAQERLTNNILVTSLSITCRFSAFLFFAHSQSQCK